MAWSGYILDLVAVAGFELGWAEVSQAAVQAGAVVPADVLGDGPAGSSSGDPGLQVDQLALDGAEEALGQGVVPAPRTQPMCTGRPRSEWKITPGGGLRAATALASAPATRLVRDRPLAALAQLDDLGLELRGERTARPGFFPCSP
jgi:hypothetical protein